MNSALDSTGAPKVTVAAIQFESIPGAVDANVGTAIEMLHDAAAQGAVLAVLPEHCLSGYEAAWIAAGAPGGGSTMPGPTLDRLAEAAAVANISVVAGEIERAPDGLYNMSVLIGGGRVLGHHRKIILTDREAAAGIRPGNRAATPVTLPGVPLPVGPMICYEHGFPEIAMDLALAGAGIIAISSAIRSGFEYLRNLRTRARAQDNGAYVIAANAIGGGDCGESMIVDPTGEVLVRAPADAPAVIVATVDPALVAQQRRLEPVLRLRRPELRPHIEASEGAPMA